MRLRGFAEMPGFDDAWIAVARARHGDAVSPQLRPLLRQVYADVLAQPLSLAALQTSLTALLEYLNGQGRTNANCWAVDLFFMSCEGWERDWTEQDLPDDFHDVLDRMGNSLHDTVNRPEIASNFDCLPEQLLEHVRRLNI
jgi:hypothetical protein